ncbi:type IV pilus assembly PilZ [Desulfovibrio sp. X2]|uniref:PilZ domain-containing protein n=1 Tax=Desulfovibrio sp. X2 TaxID=941449 RepID=UPI000358B1A7|nr:PilZ domain-containing protein [Desulfovibrio sp. X2]EPR44725.1 type IV pilus assembly PilZ [Desulfovibrio sp. X2]
MTCPSESRFDGGERRAHPRLFLKAYGFEHFCVLRLEPEGERHKARLVDISRGGARCRMVEHAKQRIVPPRRVLFESDMVCDNVPLTGISCDVRWTRDGEIGIEFHEPLSVGIAELQRMLSA